MGSPENETPQNRAETGPGERDASGKFLPGNRANPGGRPSTKWIRDWLADAVKPGGMQRRLALVQSLFLTAIDKRHKDHVRAAELLLAYEAGKPIQAVELSGPEGGGVGIEDMTSEQQNARLAQLLQKAAAAAQAAASAAHAAETEDPDGGSGSTP